MTNGPVVIEVTRGPVVESRHEGIAAVVKADGTVVASWGDIDAAVMPRSAVKPIQAIPFVESGAVERFGLGNEHMALACASHNGEARHVDTVRSWLGKIGLGEGDLECGAHPSRLVWRVEELARANAPLTNASNNCSGKHSGFLTTAVQHGEPTNGYIRYDHPVQKRFVPATMKGSAFIAERSRPIASARLASSRDGSAMLAMASARLRNGRASVGMPQPSVPYGRLSASSCARSPRTLRTRFCTGWS